MDEIQKEEAISTLTSVLDTLNELEVKGKRNCTIVVACMNDLGQAIKMLRGKENKDGNADSKSKS